MGRAVDEAGPDGIEQHVAEDGEEMLVLLNRGTLIAALPDVPATVVVPMVAANVAGEPPLHDRAEGGRGFRLQDEVEVVRHHAEAEQRDGELLLRAGEQVAEGPVVGSFVKDGARPLPRFKT